MITTILALSIIAPTVQSKYRTCTVNGEHSANDEIATRDYNGVRWSFCCDDCLPQFDKEPAKYAELRSEDKTAAGVFLFDPISGNRLKSNDAKGGYTDYKGVRYMFASKENKKKFDANMSKFGTLPKQDALYCPVAKEEVESYAAASGYHDFEGVRYYFCCAGCEAPFKKNPKEYISNAKGHTGAPKIANEVVK